jgi:hypothetical protein
MLVKDGGDDFDSIRERMLDVSVTVKVDARIETSAVVVGFLLENSRPQFIYVLLCKHSLDLLADDTGFLGGAKNKYAIHVGFGHVLE